MLLPRASVQPKIDSPRGLALFMRWTLGFLMPSSAVSQRQSWPKNLAHLPLFKQVVGFLWLSLYIVTLLSLISYDPADLGFNVYPAQPDPVQFHRLRRRRAGLGALLSASASAPISFPSSSLCCCVASFLGIEIKWRWKPLWLVLFLVSACACSTSSTSAAGI